MIRISDKAASKAPLILENDGVSAAKDLKARYDAGERNFTGDDFDSKIYGHDTVKSLLKIVQHNKCCFCESKISHISYGDVEHFRPKAGWVQDNEKLNKPGYYWLAYDWDNLLLSCQICNQRYKKNCFPLISNADRAFSHNIDEKQELPLFIHPANENPEDFITFVEEIIVAINDNDRGRHTIDSLGIDRDTLDEQRIEKLNPIRQLYSIAKGCPDTAPHTKQEAKDAIIGYYNDSKLNSTQYASMLRAFFKVNPIDF